MNNKVTNKFTFIILTIIFFPLLIITTVFFTSRLRQTSQSIGKINNNSITTQIENIQPNYIEESNMTYRRQTNMSFRCNNNLQILNELKKQFTDSRLLFFSNLLNLNQVIKYSANEPFFGFPIDDSYQIEFNTKFNNIENVNSKINIVIENLVKSGFKLDKLNTFSNIGFWGQKFSVIKDNEYYILTPGISSIEISCIGNSIKNNITRDTLLEINKIAKFKPDEFVEIWDANDSALRLNIGKVDSMGGSGEFWFKINGSWKMVFNGQNNPVCEEIEKYHAGKGLPCECNENSLPTCKGIIDY